MGRLYDIIQRHIDAQPYPPSVRQVAIQLGVAPTTLRNWRNPKDMPAAEHLAALARLTKTPIKEVFDAAGFDAGYLPEIPDEGPEPNTERDAG